MQATQARQDSALMMQAHAAMCQMCLRASYSGHSCTLRAPGVLLCMRLGAHSPACCSYCFWRCSQSSTMPRTLMPGPSLASERLRGYCAYLLASYRMSSCPTS